MEYTIKLSYEEMERIIIGKLQDDFINLYNDVNNLKAKPDLKEYQRADLFIMEATFEAMKTVLEYYMVPSEAGAFFREVSGED